MIRPKHVAQMAAMVETLSKKEVELTGKVSLEGHLARLDILTYQLRYFRGGGSMGKELALAEFAIASALRFLRETKEKEARAYERN